MQENTAFKVNAPNIVGDVIDGEAIIVNLEKGLYYSLDEVGGELWGLLQQEHTIKDMVAFLTGKYDVSPSAATAAVVKLVEDLHQEQLVTPLSDSPHLSADGTDSTGSLAFAQPELIKYDDMTELLQLDPIHDVDDMGWPIAKSDQS